MDFSAVRLWVVHRVEFVGLPAVGCSSLGLLSLPSSVQLKEVAPFWNGMFTAPFATKKPLGSYFSGMPAALLCTEPTAVTFEMLENRLRVISSDSTGGGCKVQAPQRATTKTLVANGIAAPAGILTHCAISLLETRSHDTFDCRFLKWYLNREGHKGCRLSISPFILASIAKTEIRLSSRIPEISDSGRAKLKWFSGHNESSL